MKKLQQNKTSHNPTLQPKTLIIYNELTQKHQLTIKSHPERPERTIKLVEFLKSSIKEQQKQEQKQEGKVYSYQLKLYHELLLGYNLTDEELQGLTIQTIKKIHGDKYYDFVQGMWCEGLSKKEMFISVDTYYTQQTYQAALEAAKVMLLAVEIGKQKLEQKQSENNLNPNNNNIFALIRPPGHHSGMKHCPHGFSFFNNIALAVEHYTKQTKLSAIIIDWDIHHGQGTQKIFYNRSDVLYISLHRFDEGKFFPHVKQSGVSFCGTGDGEGFNVNIPWNFPETSTSGQKKTHIVVNNINQGSSCNDHKETSCRCRTRSQTVGDQEYLYCFEHIIMPIVKEYDSNNNKNVGAVFISCGFDGAQGDLIGDAQISKNGYFQMSKQLAALGKPIYLALQGGYCIDSILWGADSVLKGLQQGMVLKEESNNNNNKTFYETPKFSSLNKFAQEDIQKVIIQQQKYWKLNTPF